ncbi:MAG: hypothetical protein J0I06_13185 [Planctomycetes bacterium]|nr:hypothetical protein [Planctomycetota bacterium]
MAAVVEPKDAAAKYNSQVDEQIAQATSRIRTHDLAFGGLSLAALVLIYATAMIALDRYLNLPEWVRQVALAGFGAVLATTAYLTLFSPLRKRINPLYAARQVERTIEDPKNSVTGYVDAREKGDLNATVKAALASKAAKAAAEADVNKAVDHRSLAYIGAVAVVFLLALVVLFFVFRPTQFASLAARAFVPFSSDPIATRTQLTVVKPDPVEPTVTTGQPVTVAVYVGGKVPNPNGPEKVRLLIRHNPADPNYDELPMVQGDTSRDWELRVPDYLVQNGFWYKVAAGDAVTPEYKVTVRSLPMFTSFQATYEYPAYLRRKTDTSDDPVIKAYRGTTVTLVARTNRPVRDGLLVVEPGAARVAGVPDPADPNAVRFVFKLTESGKYKLTFNAANGERTVDPFQGTIIVESDAAPRLVITKPEDDPTAEPPNETREPANGIVKIEGKVGDDFGVDTITLKVRIVSPVERPLKDVPYLNGKSPSFRREKDNTWPTDVDYKGSIDLAALTKDAAGLPIEKLEPETVIEYWLEAADNCTEPKPNVGASNRKRVRLTPPKVEEKDKQNLDEQKKDRKDEEQKHNDNQKNKLDNERREPQKGQPKQGERPENKPDPAAGNKGDNKPDERPMPKEGDPENPPKGPNDPKNPPRPKKPEGTPDTGKMGDPMGPMDGNPKGDAKPDGKNAKNAKGGNSDPKVDDVARDLKNELDKDKDKDKENGGSAKPGGAPPEDRTDPGQAKPQPKDGTGGMGNPAEPKPEPQPKNDPAKPMGMNDASPGASKPEGDLKKPDDPAAPKPDQKQPDAKSGQPGAPSENRSKPAGAPAGDDKPQPKDAQPQPKDPNAKQDPNSGSAGKPDTQKKDAGDAPKPGADRPNPAADAGSKAKPMAEPKRGDEKPPAQPQPKGPPDTGTAPKSPDAKPNESDAGDAKPQTAPPAGNTKPQPKEGPMPMGKDADPKPAPGANDPKKPNETNAAETKPEGAKKEPAPGAKPVDKGTDKPPQPKTDKGDAGSAPMPKEKLDEKQRRELEQAARDLAGNDEQKKQDAREKLDKAVGQDKRKELEKLANDLKSPDEKTRTDAEKKVRDAVERAKKDGKDGTDGASEKGPNEPPKKEGPPKPKLTDEQKREIENAVNDLQSPDPNKKRAAQEKLDKMIGEQKRKEVEQMMEDLKSGDKDRQDAARKKIDDFKKEFDKQPGGKKDEPGEPKGKEPGGKKDDTGEPKGKEPTPEELNDLMKKAQDLQSKDEGKRKQAQKDLDDKLGEEKRKQLEDLLKNENLNDAQSADKVRQQLKEWQQGLGRGTEAKGPMTAKQEKLRTAELMLEQFQNEENRKRLKDKKGWTDAEYDKFLKDYKDHVERLRDEVKRDRARPTAPTPKDPSDPSIKAGGGARVEGGTGPGGTGAGIGGPTAAPPGFEDAKRRFEEALKKR